MYDFKRVFLIVLDSVGIGASHDAHLFGDEGSNTLGHIAERMDGLKLPNLERLGLGNIEQIKGIAQTTPTDSYYCKMAESSKGKDTMTGHWELMGLNISTPFQVFPNGFPHELIKQIEEQTNQKVIGNKVASGTDIIAELGEEHMKTGAIIVYTSADSVLQIAAHEGVIPIAEQYKICEIVRDLTLTDKYLVGRVIARPFVGMPGAFVRTANRHDYALKPYDRTVMNELKDSGFTVLAIGKISDIYDGEGVTTSVRTISNMDGMDKLIASAEADFTGLSFVNLVDFDALYGHRRDPIGYGTALEQFDERLPELLQQLTADDLLLITADHGNDPTFKGTDHTREYVPLIVHSKRFKEGEKIPNRKTFADVGATIADNFKVKRPPHGESFLHILK